MTVSETQVTVAFVGYAVWALSWSVAERLGPRWHNTVSIAGTAALVAGMLALL